jgi:hypothetical protein
LQTAILRLHAIAVIRLRLGRTPFPILTLCAVALRTIAVLLRVIGILTITLLLLRTISILCAVTILAITLVLLCTIPILLPAISVTLLVLRTTPIWFSLIKLLTSVSAFFLIGIVLLSRFVLRRGFVSLLILALQRVRRRAYGSAEQ